VLAGFTAFAGVFGGIGVAAGRDAGDSWAATAVLTVAGTAALALTRLPRPHGLLPGAGFVAAGAGGVVGVALTLSLRTVGPAGPVIAGAAGVALLAFGVFLASRPVPWAGVLALGGALTLTAAVVLLEAERFADLSPIALAVTVPAALAAVRLPAGRRATTASALAAPAAAILLARADDLFPPTVAGLLLALLAATAFALAALRAGRAEEWVCAVAGSVAGLAAGVMTATVAAWGQVALQLAIAGVAAGGYALAAHRRWVGVVAVADLVVASWIAVGGAQVETVEAYTLPAATGLLIVAIPQLRSGARSWTAEGAAAGVAVVPSAVLVVADPTALRLVLVVVGAVALTVLGTLRHRQAPFVVGTASLAFVVIGRLAPYAPLLPRWLTLGAAGLLLLVLGATYEKRRKQAREAVAWVAHMR
jgi:hypothetical protein